MSYNYDINPWDDNYSTGQQNSSAGGGGGGYGSYQASGNDYSYSQGYGQEQVQYQQQDQQMYSEQEQSQEQPSEPNNAPQESQSWFARLLLPFFPDKSKINLPFCDALVQHINRDLLISKIFYFFFYSAFGSLFPLMGVYFKQLGMNPAQVGILTGVRPFIEIFSAPFWHSLADKFNKQKALLIFSLVSWIVFTYSLAHIRPPASACVAFNDSVYLLYTPYSANDLSNYDVGGLESAEEKSKNAEEGKRNEALQYNQAESLPEKEGKGEILANEENQNEQRRRKRQAYKYDDDVAPDYNESPDRNRYTYTIEAADSGLDALHREPETPEVELDLDSDFDDRLLDEGQTFDLPSKMRNKNEQSIRSIKGRQKRETKDDDLLGESDETEPEHDEEPRTKSNQEKQQKNKQQKTNNNKYNDRDSESDEEQDEPEENDYEGSRKKQTPSPTTSTTTLPTVTTSKAEVSGINEKTESQSANQAQKSRRVYKQRHKTPPTHIVGMSPITVEYAANYNKEKHSKFVTPMFSTIVYKLDDIKEVFFLLLLLICLGEFFSAPALTIADSATLSYLGDNTDLYGRQRLFGSLSWAITLLLVGMALDNSTSINGHPCGPHPRERSYTVCFAIFSLLMAFALITATQFRFSNSKSSNSKGNQQALIVASTTDSKTVVTKTVDGTAVDDLYASTQPRSIFNTAPPVNAPPPNATDVSGSNKFEYLEKWKSAIFAQNTKELPQWVNVFRQFKNPLHLMYLFITWFLGCGVGLVFTFLFWHLQDVGGTPTLFGFCSVINHISEILAYFFSFNFIKRFGHTRVLSFGLGCNVIRFLYVAFLTNPYYALPFELVQGITHAACFAACCSYISHISKPELRTSTQGVMQGLHHGIGRACGTIIGGYMINAIGSRASFCIYGLLSGCVLAGFLHLRKKESYLGEEVKVDDSEALGGYGAPQGVPSAIPVANQNQQDIDYQW